MSSHREAPGISKDPVADNTDTYAFVSPDRPGMVTLLANYIPLQDPCGGPNFFEFGDDVLYQIKVDNNGDGYADVIYEFVFTTEVTNPNTFLYNVGQITSLDSPNWIRKQTYTVRRKRRMLNGDYAIEMQEVGVPCPPCNVGGRSTPNYGALAMQAVATLGSGEHVFAGQRSDGFYVDLGAIFDLGTLRPFQHLHLIPSADAAGINSLRDYNVHTIAVQVPMSILTKDRKTPTDPMKAASVIGVWATASRQKGSVRLPSGEVQSSGPFMQVSRLGNPLFNEVIVPMAEKDGWNALQPADDSRFAKYVAKPELAKLLPVLYPGVFPHLAAYKKSRADLLAILLTGIPSGIIPGFQNFTGTTQADMLRLNMAIKPASKPNDFGILGKDLAGFPNGRRVNDDIVSIELRAVAGATIPLVDPGYEPDSAASALTEGLSSKSVRPTLPHFPYLGEPLDGTSTAVA